jgi:hypothetical protein
VSELMRRLPEPTLFTPTWGGKTHAIVKAGANRTHGPTGPKPSAPFTCHGSIFQRRQDLGDSPVGTAAAALDVSSRNVGAGPQIFPVWLDTGPKHPPRTARCKAPNARPAGKTGSPSSPV